MRALLLLAAACSMSGAASVPDPREIVRRSVERMNENLAIARNYTFLERSETRELDSNGQVKSRKILLYDVTLLEGSPYRRLVGKDDHALSAAEERGEEKKLQFSITERRKETPAQRARRIAEWEKKRQREREPLDEIADGFNFRLASEEQMDGRDVWVIEATSRPGYQARSSMARLFPKFRGRLWIDKADQQWIKTEAEAIDNISVGLFVARLSKGARLAIQMTRVNGEVWLPKRIEARGSARLVLVKNIRVESDTSFSNYRKFQSDSHIVPLPPQN